jgi:hypothetical protein
MRTESSGSRGPDSGSARWTTRDEAKPASRTQRRRDDRDAIDDGRFVSDVRSLAERYRETLDRLGR